MMNERKISNIATSVSYSLITIVSLGVCFSNEADFLYKWFSGMIAVISFIAQILFLTHSKYYLTAVRMLIPSLVVLTLLEFSYFGFQFPKYWSFLLLMSIVEKAYGSHL